jgi:hypothetical protein
MSIIVAAIALALYFFGLPTVGIILLLLMALNSFAGLSRAVINPNWYKAMAYANGVQPNLVRLILVKSVSTVTVIGLAYWMYVAS